MAARRVEIIEKFTRFLDETDQSEEEVQLRWTSEVQPYVNAFVQECDEARTLEDYHNAVLYDGRKPDGVLFAGRPPLILRTVSWLFWLAS